MLKNLEAKIILGAAKVKNKVMAPLMNNKGEGDERSTLSKIFQYAPLAITLMIVGAVLLLVTTNWPTVKTNIEGFVNKWVNFTF